MVFRHCSIGGKVYKGDPQLDTEEVVKVQAGGLGPSSAESSTTASGSPDLMGTDSVKRSGGVLTHFRDATLKSDLDHAVAADPQSENAAHARLLNGFFTVLALCHTVLTVVDPETGAIEYKAQSPDEAALVQAAADVGFVFRGRDREILNLQTPFSETVEKYELLNILEFTSARKRMSVVVRKLDGEDERLLLLTKGADNVIFERLKAGWEELRNSTGKDLDAFANDGLRTLTLAYKIIPGE
jgi:phospholipid-translocating ATPase